MTIQEYLRQSTTLDQRISLELDRLDRLRMLSVSVSAPAPGRDRVQTSRCGEASFTHIVERIDETTARINREIDLLMDLKNQIDEVIRQLPTGILQMVIAYRYLEGLSWSKIAAAMYISKTTAVNLHNKAIGLLRLPEHPIVIGSLPEEEAE